MMARCQCCKALIKERKKPKEHQLPRYAYIDQKMVFFCGSMCASEWYTNAVEDSAQASTIIYHGGAQ